ncbi:MAG: hypothetical protein U0R17_06685 [Acidimicrobiia bacterium]
MEEEYIEPPKQITCVDCGGEAFLLDRLDENEKVLKGSVLSYRCKDCLDRWDIEIGE